MTEPDLKVGRGSDRDYCEHWPTEGHYWASYNVTHHSFTHQTGLWYRVCQGCRYVDLSEIVERFLDQRAHLVAAGHRAWQLSVIRTSLAHHLNPVDDPCRERDVLWPCDVAIALDGGTTATIEPCCGPHDTAPGPNAYTPATGSDSSPTNPVDGSNGSPTPPAAGHSPTPS